MADTFFIDTEIISCEIIREDDNLAMSSRNIRLSSYGRKLATLYAGVIRKDSAISDIIIELEGNGIKVDYLEEHFGRRFAAVIIDEIRLIDNFDLKECC